MNEVMNKTKALCLAGECDHVTRSVLEADPFGFTDDEWNEATVHDLRAENERLREVLQDFDRFARVAGSHEYVNSPFEAEVRHVLGEPIPGPDST